MPTDWDVLQTMERFGGGFARAIAAAAHRADPEHLARLKAAFPELWTKYGEMSELVKRQEAERGES